MEYLAKKVTAQTTGNNTNESICVIASLPTSGDTIFVSVKCVSRDNTTSNKSQTTHLEGVAVNDGGAVSVSTAGSNSQPTNSPAFNSCALIGSGTNLELQLYHQPGGSTANHTVLFTVEEIE